MEDRRAEICEALGLGDVFKVHELILSGLVRGPLPLLQKGLTARVLTELGYNLPGLQRLGFDEDDLEALGFRIMRRSGNAAPAAPAQPAPEAVEEKSSPRWLA